MKTAPVTVQSDPKSFDTNVKRFRLHGVVLKSSCPECGEECSRDLGDNYLSEPRANEPFEETFCHEPETEGDEYICHEWTVRIILRITVEPAPAA